MDQQSVTPASLSPTFVIGERESRGMSRKFGRVGTLSCRGTQGCRGAGEKDAGFPLTTCGNDRGGGLRKGRPPTVVIEGQRGGLRKCRRGTGDHKPVTGHATLSFPRSLSPTFVIGERESRRLTRTGTFGTGHSRTRGNPAPRVILPTPRVILPAPLVILPPPLVILPAPPCHSERSEESRHLHARGNPEVFD